MWLSTFFTRRKRLKPLVKFSWVITRMWVGTLYNFVMLIIPLIKSENGWSYGRRNKNQWRRLECLSSSKLYRSAASAPASSYEYFPHIKAMIQFAADLEVALNFDENSGSFWRNLVQSGWFIHPGELIPSRSNIVKCSHFNWTGDSPWRRDDPTSGTEFIVVINGHTAK